MALSSQSCILTVIPGGIVPVEGATSRYRFSVHVAPRLVPGFGENELGYFPPFTVWPSNAASFARVELKGLIFGDPIATVGASRISVDPDPTLWEALFSPTMPVSPFDPAAFETKFGSSKVRSYPALSLHAWQTKFLAERMIENDTVAPTPDELAAALGSIVDLNGGGVTKELDSAIEGSFPQQGRSSRFARYLPTGPSRPLYGTSLETVADHFQ
ncbi:MAG: hypothetical protein RJB65_1502, partial [Actinomycetota bacterium]